jgi:hypothetical protein
VEPGRATAMRIVDVARALRSASPDRRMGLYDSRDGNFAGCGHGRPCVATTCGTFYGLAEDMAYLRRATQPCAKALSPHAGFL